MRDKIRKRRVSFRYSEVGNDVIFRDTDIHPWLKLDLKLKAVRGPMEAGGGPRSDACTHVFANFA